MSYYSRYNIAYIQLQAKSQEIERLSKWSDELVVDMAPDGTIYGIELLNANDQLKRDKEGRLLVVNEATGETMDIPFAV
ncbi:MAG: DUF2283 domain-containing protein [Deltaproteobacteria bacterium]|nr:DUF2283 domain-containing protein [Deltaproteobacteria bacterium]